MTTVRIYKSPLADCHVKVQRRRRHGRPRGHKRTWSIRERIIFDITVLRTDEEWDQRHEQQQRER